jgi:hypothetical protein
MDSPEHYPGTALSDGTAHLVSSQCVAGVNADTHDIAFLNTLDIEMFQGFIADFGISERLISRSGQHVEPARGDDCGSERSVARINQVDDHIRRISPA